MSLPVLAITAGDPLGVGPEVGLKALLGLQTRELARCILVADPEMLEETAHLLQIPARLRVLGAARECVPKGEVGVLAVPGFPRIEPGFGVVSPAAGRAAVACIERAVELAMAGEVDGIVTAPINKEAIRAAGCPYPGHTELLGALTGAADVRMLLVAEGLSVVHNSTHCSLREACDRCRRDRVLRTIELGRNAVLRVKGSEPRIAVAGLNPHASEHGLFGAEEQNEIQPAVEEAAARGWWVEGPLPPDTLFARARFGGYDLVVAMYHDQGHIPLKTLGFRRNPATGRWDSVSGVNVTLGLPIIRTSVDHGTAFDIAGRGLASHQSMVDAIALAARMASPPPYP